jgi:hypothetical protein
LESLVDLLTSAAGSSTSTASQPIADVEILERSILTVSEMLDRVLSYVHEVLVGKKKGDPAIGRYLMDTLGASTDDLEKGGFNASLQVRVLGISFLKVLTEFAGYTDDIVPCEPCAVAGRGIVPVSPHNVIIEWLDEDPIYLCLFYGSIRESNWKGLAIENP